VSDKAIIVEGLSKRYDLGSINSGTLSNDLKLAWAKIRGLENPISIIGEQNKLGEYWALKDVEFEIKKGESVGIIGKNGAGKSTLLKILSRVTAPTKGKIKVKGRIASLLEVGTGFHPDLSGRENIYMNGAILGMARQEINNKLDEIIAFSGVEKYIDTPVKRYSSGMYVRLAFAVAAHLESEILIVDEVLAVGDAEFQKKCLGKMNDVSTKDGRTVLFVSHNMAAIQNLCSKTIVLTQGQHAFTGKTNEGISKYLTFNSGITDNNLEKNKDRKGNGAIRFTSYEFLSADGKPINPQSGQDFTIRLKYKNNLSTNLTNFKISVGLDDEYGVRITHFNNEVSGQIEPEVQVNACEINIQIINCPLRKGSYTFTLFTTVNEEIADWIQDAGVLDVESGDYYKTGKIPSENQGCFFMDYKFEIR
jgi:lipopolysaccharide transport system ATP-binding protein